MEAEFPGYEWFSVHGNSTVTYAVGRNSGSSTSAVAKRVSGVWSLDTGVPNIGQLVSVVVAEPYVYAAGYEANSFFLQLESGVWTAVETEVIVDGLWAFSGTDLRITGHLDVPSNGLRSFFGFTYNGATLTPAQDCGTTFVGPSNEVRFAPFASHGFSPGNDIAGHRAWIVSQTADVSRSVHLGPMLSGCTSNGVTLSGEIFDYWGDELGQGWAVGQSGEIFKIDNLAVPTQQMSYTSSIIFGVWGSGSSNIWTVGQTGQIGHGPDGVSFTSEPSTFAGDLYGVFCLDALNCWAVGVAGKILKLQVNPTIAPPALTVASLHDDLFQLDATDTDCIGTPESFDMAIDLPGGTLSDGDIYIYSTSADAWILDLDDSTWNPVIASGGASSFAATDVVLPPGGYHALAIINPAGLGVADRFDAQAFTVSKDPCFFEAADFTQIINNINDLGDRINVTNEGIAGSLEVWFWLALVVSSYLLAARESWKPSRDLALAGFLISLMWGLSTLPFDWFKVVAFVVGIGGFLWTATLKRGDSLSD